MEISKSPVLRDGTTLFKNHGLNKIHLIKIDNEYRVSSRIISLGAKVKHQTVVKLLKKYEKEILNHGSWSGFKIQSKGQKTEAFLNEDQAYLLMTFLRNSETVILFKSSLVKEYSKLRKRHEKLAESHAKLEYQQNRAMGKLHRRDLTDEIKPFVEYAKNKGSTGAHFLYTNITTWINKSCGLKSVKDADEVELANISSACDIAMSTINHGMENKECYKVIKQAIKSNLGSYALLIKGGVK